MSRFQCLDHHLCGGVVLVNGRKHQLSPEGQMDVADEDTAAKLGSMPKAWARVYDGEEAQAEASEAPEAPPAPETEPEEPGEPEELEEPAEVDLESMSIDELKAVADEFQVPYGQKIGKALLVERIQKARS